MKLASLTYIRSFILSVFFLLFFSGAASAFISGEVRERYTPFEVRMLAYADILGQQCGLKMTKKARTRYNKIIIRSIEYGEENLNIFDKYYYRLRAAEHNPIFYVKSKRGSRTTYQKRLGDGLHLLVNEVINGIYRLPCKEIIKRAKRGNIYKTLYQ